jgi:tetratricopeptide (TPR) repeat protein
MSETATFPQLLHQAQEAQANEQYGLAIHLYEVLLGQIGQEISDPPLKEMRLTALREQGQLWHRLGNQNASLERFGRYYLEVGTSRRAIDALSLIGRQHSQMGQHQKALGAHREALQLATALNDTEGRARAYSGVGWALWGLGRLEEALSNLDKALALFGQLHDSRQQRRVWNLLGITYLDMGKIDKSIAAYEAALALAPETLDTWDRAIFLGNLGESYQCLFDMEQALVYHKKAMRLAEMIEAPSAVADICRNIGVDLVYLGETERGIEHLYTALTLSEETGQPDIKMQTLYRLVLAELGCGNVTTAQEHATALHQLAEAGQATGYLADAYHALGLCHQYLQDEKSARQLWQQAILIAHEAGKQMLIWQLHAALANIAPTPELAAIHQRMAAEMIEQIVYPIEDEALRRKFLKAEPIQAVLSKVNRRRGDTGRLISSWLSD